MDNILQFDLTALTPADRQVLSQQGIPADCAISPAVQSLLDRAKIIYRRTAHPAGLQEVITAVDFGAVFSGEGDNDPEAPLSLIFPQARNLALFAITLGPKISAAIEALFNDGDFALGYMLDTIASLAADEAVNLLEQQYARTDTIAGDTALAYSPGYCGWHISGQKKLFSFLQPERIGIRLNESCLMQPLKSVSGVIVAGEKKIHKFKPAFGFCRSCRTHSCLARFNTLNT
ncbi:MAG: vitamin B12 dependent-methionine synthase activation domain-containing protein [Candidatus Neomarinimicrobiota bacterium]